MTSPSSAFGVNVSPECSLTRTGDHMRTRE